MWFLAKKTYIDSLKLRYDGGLLLKSGTIWLNFFKLAQFWLFKNTDFIGLALPVESHFWLLLSCHTLFNKFNLYHFQAPFYVFLASFFSFFKYNHTYQFFNILYNCPNISNFLIFLNYSKGRSCFTVAEQKRVRIYRKS